MSYNNLSTTFLDTDQIFFNISIKMKKITP